MFPAGALAEAREILDGNPPPDPDASIRKDLTHLKVYAIDSEDTMEVYYKILSSFFLFSVSVNGCLRYVQYTAVIPL